MLAVGTGGLEVPAGEATWPDRGASSRNYLELKKGVGEMLKKVATMLGAMIGLATLTPTPLQAARVVERIIARVNNEIVTQRMYEQEKQKLRQQLAQDLSGPELEVQFREQSKNLLRDL